MTVTPLSLQERFENLRTNKLFETFVVTIIIVFFIFYCCSI